MEETGYAHAIAHFITKWIQPKRAILAVVLSGALLTYGGVSLFVVAFVLYPIATLLLKEADIPNDSFLNNRSWCFYIYDDSFTRKS